MLTDDEKLAEFIHAVSILTPKAHITNPMNTRHDAEFVMFQRGYDLGHTVVSRSKPPTGKEPMGEARVLLNSRITKHFKNNKMLWVYVDKADTSKMKFRTKESITLNNDIYVCAADVFNCPDIAKRSLKSYL